MNSHPTVRGLLPLHVLLLIGFAVACDSSSPVARLTEPTAEALVVPHADIKAHKLFTNWSAPVDLGAAINASNSELSPALSPDGLSLFFASARDGGMGGWDIWVSRRESPCTTFGAPVNLGLAINTAEREQGAFISRDGHLLFFVRGNAELTSGDIYVSRRKNKHDDSGWGEPVLLGEHVNTAQLETEPWFVDGAGHGTGLLYFGRGPGNQEQDFYVARISKRGRTLGPAVALSELNSAGTLPLGNEDGIAVRKDQREAIFASRRLSTGAAELFVSTRTSVKEPWGQPQLITELNSVRPDLHPALSADARSLVFSSVRSGTGEFRLYMSTRDRGTGSLKICS